MQTISKIDWWQRRRVRWPLAAILLLGVTTTYALVVSNTSRVMVCNLTGENISELTVTACGQSQTFYHVEEDESVRLKLKATGTRSEISVTTNDVAMWHGEYIEPRGGYRTIVKLGRDGHVEAVTTISWWRTLMDSRTTF